MKNVLFAALAATAISAPAMASTYLAHSNYDNDVDSWKVRDNLSGNVTYFTPSWAPSGGVPTGHLEFADVTPGGYLFEAPDHFHGDFSSAVGNGGIFFDWKADMIMDNKRPGVSLYRDGVRLIGLGSFGLAESQWHHLDFAFDLSAGWLVDLGNGAQTATMADIQWVLEDVDDLRIVGETWTGVSETTWLDNPTIYTNVPAPGALALLVGAGLILPRRRR
ncbi:MAG: hypothetical protein P8M22_00780 [Phycisphaerales bacterium]|nr:hypothetical protein [Phycisphaerales bacterium]